MHAQPTPHLDGNALAGPLGDVFGFDVTTASARCGGCGLLLVLATAMVYRNAMGTVVRCPGCDHVLATLVEAGPRRRLSLRGIAVLELPVP